MKKFQETALSKYFKEDWCKIWDDGEYEILTDYCSAVRALEGNKFVVNEDRDKYYSGSAPELIVKPFRRALSDYEYEAVKKPTKDDIKAAGRFYYFNDKYIVDGKRLRKLFDAVGGAVKVRIPTEDRHAPVYVLGKNGDGFLLPLRVVPQR
jgi:hypothetical protein